MAAGQSRHLTAISRLSCTVQTQIFVTIPAGLVIPLDMDFQNAILVHKYVPDLGYVTDFERYSSCIFVHLGFEHAATIFTWKIDQDEVFSLNFFTSVSHEFFLKFLRLIFRFDFGVDLALISLSMSQIFRWMTFFNCKLFFKWFLLKLYRSHWDSNWSIAIITSTVKKGCKYSVSI